MATPCRLRHRCDVHHRVVAPRSLPFRSGLRPTRWRCATACELRAKPGPTSSQQIRRPQTQPSLPHGRARSHAPSRTQQGLRRETPSRGKNRPRNPTLSPALRRPKRLATPRAPEPTDHCLTDIEGSDANALVRAKGPAHCGGQPNVLTRPSSRSPPTKEGVGRAPAGPNQAQRRSRIQRSASSGMD
jgi:hypothetical protein